MWEEMQCRGDDLSWDVSKGMFQEKLWKVVYFYRSEALTEKFGEDELRRVHRSGVRRNSYHKSSKKILEMNSKNIPNIQATNITENVKLLFDEEFRC